MKILMTGASGLLGSNLLPFLRDKGFDVTSLSKSGKTDINCDLTDRDLCRKNLDKISPDVIINLVALTVVDECEKNPNKAFLYNVKTAENLVEWIKTAGKKVRMIHMSTDHVYNDKNPQTEEKVNLINTYAVTKYRSEKVVSQIDGTVLRTNFFGFHKEDTGRGFFGYIIKSLKSNTHFYISTNAMFNPLSIETFCDCVLAVLRKPVGGVYNVGSRGNGISKGDLIRKICGMLGANDKLMIPDNISYFETKSTRPVDMRMNCDLFEKTFDVRLPELNDEINKVLAGKIQ